MTPQNSYISAQGKVPSKLNPSCHYKPIRFFSVILQPFKLFYLVLSNYDLVLFLLALSTPAVYLSPTFLDLLCYWTFVCTWTILCPVPWIVFAGAGSDSAWLTTLLSCPLAFLPCWTAYPLLTPWTTESSRPHMLGGLIKYCFLLLWT